MGVDVRYRVLRPPYFSLGAGLVVALVLMVSSVGVVLVVSLVALAVPARAAGPPISPGAPMTAQAYSAPPEGKPTAPVSADLVAHPARPGRVVALTFDDGPNPVYTPQVVALLARYHVVATFCMIGSEAARHPEIVRDVVAAGMRLCDHTVSHDEQLSRRPESRIDAEIVGCRTDLRTAAGSDVPVGYFRAPAGRWSGPMRQIAARNGMKPLSWSLDPRDWSRPGTGRIVAAVQQRVQPGAVVLLHDGGGRRDQTVAALAQLLPWFIAQGYQFVAP
ncbi:MAG: polysaccharide deacetylase family protein [Pseudonocardiaceae bacterium]